MTWLQIAYIVFLYFLLAEVVFRSIQNQFTKPEPEPKPFALAVFHALDMTDGVMFNVFLILAYLAWPVTLISVALITRRDRIHAVTRKLTS